MFHKAQICAASAHLPAWQGTSCGTRVQRLSPSSTTTKHGTFPGSNILLLCSNLHKKKKREILLRISLQVRRFIRQQVRALNSLHNTPFDGASVISHCWLCDKTARKVSCEVSKDCRNTTQHFTLSLTDSFTDEKPVAAPRAGDSERNGCYLHAGEFRGKQMFMKANFIY